MRWSCDDPVHALLGHSRTSQLFVQRRFQPKHNNGPRCARVENSTAIRGQGIALGPTARHGLLGAPS
ncbi:unnamed protein product [Chondrus crispus]|uniref:Uncharacterized protein n=1 Tax=Chondrus crispus TaxID=2769 RepID=R7QBH4_CHOCR|nr:unnamed protein product [Chondrus crispus]CDF34771.1 unnamed protein product [Chondrus crispus]|eukprot:XP_005714590.1 unnamed protein product [Chondrus crispus]